MDEAGDPCYRPLSRGCCLYKWAHCGSVFIGFRITIFYSAFLSTPWKSGYKEASVLCTALRNTDALQRRCFWRAGGSCSWESARISQCKIRDSLPCWQDDSALRDVQYGTTMSSFWVLTAKTRRASLQWILGGKRQMALTRKLPNVKKKKRSSFLMET